MSTFTAYKCDNCGQPKKDVNQWWLVSMMGAIPAIIVRHWDEDAAAIPETKHLCGRQCVQQIAERYMTTGSLEAGPAVSAENAMKGDR